MFIEWVAAGAAFGVEAFFAVFVFLLCAGVMLGLAGIIGGFFKAGSGEDE